MTGIEPASKAWEAFILPMNYIRKTKNEDNNTVVGLFAKMYPTSLL